MPRIIPPETDETKIAVMANQVSTIDAKVTRIEIKLDQNYVTKDSFEPVKRIVYGLVALILTAVVGALVALVINR